MLKKTIVFITHDFDEAIRLADRIAIMKDGAIVQVGTPEELVLNPATDYVAEFTRDVQRAKVVSARQPHASLRQGASGCRARSQPAPRSPSFAAAIVVRDGTAGGRRPMASGKSIGEVDAATR